MRRELRQADMHIPLNKSSMGEEEKNAAKAVIDSDNLTMGEQCRAFEREFADYLGVEHAVMVNSGSSANLIALFAMADALIPSDGALPRRIRPGSEVIVPALTWSTTIWPVLQVGAKPVFVDCDPHSLQMEPDAIEAAITPETSAIIVVHVLGGAVNVADVEAIARRRKLWLFEDTCEALGVAWNGKKGRQLRPSRQLQLLFFPPHHHHRRRNGGDQRCATGRPAAGDPRPWMGSRHARAQGNRGRLSAHRSPLSVPDHRVQRAPDRDQWRRSGSSN